MRDGFRLLGPVNFFDQSFSELAVLPLIPDCGMSFDGIQLFLQGFELSPHILLFCVNIMLQLTVRLHGIGVNHLPPYDLGTALLDPLPLTPACTWY